MKKHIVLIAVVCFGFVAHAQTGKGNFMIGGSMSFLHDKTEPVAPNTFALIQTNSIFSVSPTVGYFPVKNFLVGLQTTISKGWNSNYKDVKDNSYAIGPLMRYYIPFAGKFAAFGEFAAGYNSHTQQLVNTADPSNLAEAKWKYSSVRAGAGITWFPVSNIGIEGILGYRKNTFDKDNRVYHGFESWLYFNVGLQFYLNRNN